MNNVNLENEIKECIIERLNLEVSPDEIDNDSPIFKSQDDDAEEVEGSLGLDSVDALEIVVAMNNKYDIEITDNDMMIFQSINTIADFIRERRG
ncbi:MAG: phosphopantetheine-binding protein [Lutisporaceae bacterium]